MSDLTRILESIEAGNSKASEELLNLVYGELRKLAAHKMASEPTGHTLQPTALVHEAWLRLAGEENQQWRNSRHFLAVAAEAMRRILVDSARRKKRLKRGGDQERIALEDVVLCAPLPDDDLLALDEGLERLAELNPRAAQVVKLCFFAGLTQEQAARQLELSVSSVERLWSFARAWLFRELQSERNLSDG